MSPIHHQLLTNLHGAHVYTILEMMHCGLQHAFAGTSGAATDLCVSTDCNRLSVQAAVLQNVALTSFEKHRHWTG